MLPATNRGSHPGLALLALLCAACARPPPAGRLALLIGAPWPGETAMHDDLEAMSAALQRRGFGTDEIQVLEGTLTRTRVLGMLDSASRQAAAWETGSVFLYYSGHGTPTSLDESTAGAALQFQDGLPEATNREHWISWADVFASLRLPEGVALVMLPDT